MAHMMEASAPANLTFLQIVSGELTIGNEEKSGPMWMTRYLLLCPSSSVRMFFAQLLACTLRSAINEHGVVVDVGQVLHSPLPVFHLPSSYLLSSCISLCLFLLPPLPFPNSTFSSNHV